MNGRWIDPEDPICYKCSECGKYTNQIAWKTVKFYEYCPNCGAKMDGAIVGYKCDDCLNARSVESENGLHRVCSLSDIRAMKCISGITDEKRI